MKPRFGAFKFNAISVSPTGWIQSDWNTDLYNILWSATSTAHIKFCKSGQYLISKSDLAASSTVILLGIALNMMLTRFLTNIRNDYSLDWILPRNSFAKYRCPVAFNPFSGRTNVSSSTEYWFFSLVFFYFDSPLPALVADELKYQNYIGWTCFLT